MDIRNYFGIASKSKSSGSASSSKAQPNGTRGKRKRQLDEDDDVEVTRGARRGTGSKPAKMKKTAVIYDSDSDDEPALKKKKALLTKTVSTSKTSKKVLSPSPVKRKTITPSEFFGTSPINRSAKKTGVKQDDPPRKAELVFKNEHHGDEDFLLTLEQIDKQHKTPTKPTRIDDIRSEEKPSPSRRSPRVYKMESSPVFKKGLASKVADKVRTAQITLAEETPERNQGQRSRLRSAAATLHEMPLRPRRTSIQEATPTKSTPTKATPKKSTPSKSTTQKATPNKSLSDRTTPNKSTSDRPTPSQSRTTPHKPTTSEAASSRATPTTRERTIPLKTPIREGGAGAATPDSTGKKKGGGPGYRSYLNREGPKALGARDFPEGAEGCLQGLQFVITGVLDYVEKEEAKDAIEKLGGKVMASVTKKTSYLVTGREPGPAKCQKAETLRTKILTEDELFDLIEKRPGKRPAASQAVATKKPSFTVLESPEKKFQPPKITAVPDVTPAQGLQSEESLLWVDKYKPTKLKQLIGQQGARSCANKLLKWLKRWHDNNYGPNKEKAHFNKDDGFCFKAALLSGPPGIGKTTTAELVCKELGFETLELNASSSRSKKTLDVVMKEFMQSDSIQGYLKVKGEAGQRSSAAVKTHRQCLLMDEVDGMAGNEDRGGVQEFIQLLRKSHIPVICMCNDRNHPKIRSLSNHCFDLRFHRPQLKQIMGAMLSIAFKEGVTVPPQAMEHIIAAANQDIRQVLHNMSVWSAGRKQLSPEQIQTDSSNAKKDLKLGPWDVLRQVFSCGEEEMKMTVADKINLFFHDYSIAPLFVQENYLSVSPKKAKTLQDRLDRISRAADSLCCGDLVDKKIRTSQSWSLLPTQAVFASVIPGNIMRGYMKGRIDFPSWLGKNSTRNKNRRLLQEIQQHMRLSSSGSINDINCDYVPHLRSFLTRPLVSRETEGVPEVVELLNSYDLTREDFDTVIEVGQYAGKGKPMADVQSKVKAAFTRAFNKEGHMVPYTYGNVTKKRRGATATGDMDGYGEEEEEADGESGDDDDDDIAHHAMIKVRKGKGDTTGVKSQGAKGKAPARGKPTAKGRSKTAKK